MIICPAPANLSAAPLAEIQALEKKVGVILIAYKQVPKIARLTGEEMESVRKVEQETGKILLAYET